VSGRKFLGKISRCSKSIHYENSNRNVFNRALWGPHVANSKDMGRFKIKKEEASSRGVRRIKAVLIKD